MTYHHEIPERNKGEIFTLQCDAIIYLKLCSFSRDRQQHVKSMVIEAVTEQKRTCDRSELNGP